MSSVRSTASGAVVVALLLACLTAPVSACDERFVKACERAAKTAVVPVTQDSAPAAKKKSIKRVHVLASKRVKHVRFVARRAPGFAVKQAGMELASASAQPVALRESALSRRFRGFIDPRPMAQHAFEILRKPHLMLANLEPPEAGPTIEAADMVPAVPIIPAVSVASARQDRVAPQPAMIQLASAESRPVVLPDLPRHAAAPASAGAPILAAANVAPVTAMAFQAVVSEAPAAPASPPNPFSFHALMLAICGALGAASALRFIVGA